MKKKEFEQLILDYDIPLEKWTPLCKIKTIILKNKLEIFPNWKNIYFLITKNFKILIKFGESFPYGARLPLDFIPINNFEVIFPNFYRIQDTEFYKDFRNPQVGDSIVSIENNKVITTAIISKVLYYKNESLKISFSNYLNLSEESKLAFYETSKHYGLCSHSNIRPGIFMEFLTHFGKEYKKYGIVHQRISYRKISKIIFKDKFYDK